MRRVLIAMGLLSLLSGCASSGPYVLRASDCGITHYGKDWVKANGARATWTGGCESGRASGTGKMTLTTKNGETKTYEGRMRAGNFSTPAGDTAVYNDGQTEYRGRFSAGTFFGGQIYKDGALWFEGDTDGWQNLRSGKLQLADGSSLVGRFISNAPVIAADGRGVQRGIHAAADGRALHWIEEEKLYATEQAWQQAAADNLRRAEEAERLSQRRSALDSKLGTLRAKLYEGKVHKEVGTSGEALMYYSENMEIEQAEIGMLDQMLKKCPAACPYTDLLQKRRRESLDYYRHCETEVRKIRADRESAQRFRDAVGNVEQAVGASGVVSAKTMDLYNQTKARNEAVGNTLNRLSGSQASADFAQNLADIYTLLKE